MTNPERFSYILDAMGTAVERLDREFVVQRREVDPADHFPGIANQLGPVIELVPSAGLPIAFTETDFPGIRMALGQWIQLHLPHCGCDACDEQPDEVLGALDSWLHAVTHGTFEVRLDRRWLHTEHSYPGGSSRGSSRLERGDWRDYPALGHHRWPAWPRREK